MVMPNSSSYVVTDDQPVPERRARCKPLSQRAAHEQIARIGDEGDHGHLKIAGTAHNKRKGSVFTGRCVVQQTGQKPLKRGKTRLAGCNAQRERDGKIAQCDGHAIPDALTEHLSAEGPHRLLLPDDVRIQKRIACFHVEIAPFLFQTLSIILRRRAGEKGLVTFFVIKTLKNFYGRHKISFGRIACSGIQKAQAPLRKEQCLCFWGQRPGTRKCCACVSTRVSGSSPLAASIWAGGTWNRRAISNSASPSCA